MMNHFRELELVCPHCGGCNFVRRKWFHLLGRFECHKCGGAFFRATSVSVRTSSHRDDRSYENRNRPLGSRVGLRGSRGSRKGLLILFGGLVGMGALLYLILQYTAAVAIIAVIALGIVGVYMSSRRRCSSARREKFRLW